MFRPHSRRRNMQYTVAAALAVSMVAPLVGAQDAPPPAAPREAAPAPAPAEPPPPPVEPTPSQAPDGEPRQTNEATPPAPPPPSAPAPGEPVVAAPPPAEPKAAEPAPDAQLSAVVVTGNRLGDGTVADRPSDSVYGTNTTVTDTPRSVSQISNNQLKRDTIRTADDLVKYAPGVTRGGGQNVNIAPQIRGQNSEVFQDGQRIYNVRHPTNFNAYESADLVAGAPSVVLGPIGASGGYVNYVTKKPRFGLTNTEIAVTEGALSPAGSWQEGRLNVDTNQSIGKNFAVRASVTINRADDFYRNVSNNFNAYYGAAAWQPFKNLRIDWNASYDDYYDFNITHGWNRVTQDLIDSYGKKYDAGRATPIINTPGVGLWSPVFASGDRDSEIIGWQARENQNGKFVPTGEINTGALPSAAADKAGTLSGWVYDPNVPGNDRKKISPRQGHRAEDGATATRAATQGNINLRINEYFDLNNKLIVSRSTDTNDAVGSFLSQAWNNAIDERFEVRNHWGKRLFQRVRFRHEGNTGIGVRREQWQSLAANNSFNINPYDLTQNPTYKTPGGLLGIQSTGASGAWIGAAGTPQLTSFGYLNLPAMYPVQNGLYSERGGSPPGGAVYTSKGSMRILNLFTQQNFLFHDLVGLNAGARQSVITAEIENPVVLKPEDAVSDTGRFMNNGLQLSPLVKPIPDMTVYYTWDRSEALNTGGFYNVPTWGANNRLDPLSFTSVAKLNEVGVKYDVLPGKLFTSLSGYLSSRQTSPDINGNLAKLETKGVEGAVRAEFLRNLRGGLNLTYIHAAYTYIVPAGFSPYGFAPDNATVWGDRNVLNKRTGTKYDAAGIPSYSATGYVDYNFDFGLGAQLSAWVTSSWYVNLSETAKVPTQYNLDLNVYYRQPRWDVTLAVTNLTNAKNFVNGLSGSTTEFVQPMRPFALAGKASLRF